MTTSDAMLKTFHGSTGLPCRDCNCPHDEYAVESGLWNRVMRPDGHETDYEYLCLACFHRRVSRHIDALEAQAGRWQRQEQWMVNYGRLRTWQLEEALARIIERLRPSGYTSKRLLRWIASAALVDRINIFVVPIDHDVGKVDWERRWNGAGWWKSCRGA